MNRLLRTLLSASMLGGLLSGCALDFDEFSQSADMPDGQVSIVDAGTDASTVDMVVAMSDVGMADMMLPDMDGDGVEDGTDNCPAEPNPDQTDLDEDGLGDACDDDDDDDGILDADDNCPRTSNPDGLDLDGNGQGDACDDDADGDGLTNADEAMNGTNPLLPDSDFDGVQDGVDLCPLSIDAFNHDTDGDGLGDVCDQDDNNDGILDWWDENHLCVAGQDCEADYDRDGIVNVEDACPYHRGAADPETSQLCETRFQTWTYARDTQAMDATTAVDGQAPRLVMATAGGLVVGTNPPENVGLNYGINSYALTAMHITADDWFLITDRGVTIFEETNKRTFNIPTRDLPSGADSTLTSILGGIDSLWVGSDRGLNQLVNNEWTLLGEPDLPSADVRDLHRDGLDRVWVATSAGVLRYVGDVVDQRFEGLPNIGLITGVDAAGNDQMWLFGQDGMILLGADDGVVATFEGLTATDSSRGNTETYLAQSDGIIRIDSSLRPYPRGREPIPPGQTRAILRDFDDGQPFESFWAATSAGVFRFGGLFASFPTDQTGFCVTSAVRMSSLGSIWFGTQTGVYRQSDDGTMVALDAAMLPGYDAQNQTAPSITVVTEESGEVWVGTETGLGRYTLAGDPLDPLVAPFEGAEIHVTAIQHGFQNEVWIGTASNGLFRRNGQGQWVNYTPESAGNNLVSLQINGLTYESDTLWIATPDGISVFDTNANTFADPILQRGGLLRTDDIKGISSGGGYVFAESDAGVSIRNAQGEWRTIRRNDSETIPINAGTDEVAGSVYDGQYLWIALRPSRLQPHGSLLRRSPNPDENGSNVLFSVEQIGLPGISEVGRVSMASPGIEVIVGVCGDMASPGGLSVTGSRHLLIETLSDQAPAGFLRGRGVDAALMDGPDGQPMVVGREGQRAIADQLRPASIIRLPLPVEFPNPPTDCGVSGPGNSLWCLFGTDGFAKRDIDGQWHTTAAADLGLLDGAELREIQVLGESLWWMATSRGLFRFQGGGLIDFNVARTGGGLPSDDVRTLLVHENKVYAGTANGIGVLDTVENSWSQIGEDHLRNVSIRSLAMGPGNILWIGTDLGLYKHPLAEGDAQFFGLANGLIAPRVQDVELDISDAQELRAVYIATEGGIGRSDGIGDFESIGFAQGLPGRAAKKIRLAPTGHIWVLSDHGIGRLNIQ